jgi:hypothetical protein
MLIPPRCHQPSRIELVHVDVRALQRRKRSAEVVDSRVLVEIIPEKSSP